MTTDRIEKTVLLRAPMNRVWRAISDSTEFGAWFGIKFAGPFTAGSPIRGSIVPTAMDPKVAESQKKHEGLQFEIWIEQIQPEHLFSFRWHPFAIDRNVDYSAEPTTLVEFWLQQKDDGVLLTITESGFDAIPLERRAKAFSANDGGWAAQIKLIERYVTHA